MRNIELLGNLKSKNYILYGLGTTGRLIVDMLDIIGINISYILVGDGHKFENKRRDIPIYEIGELDVNKDDYCVIVTVKKDISTILSRLKSEGYDNILHVDTFDEYIKLLKIYYLDYFKKNNIDIEDREVIKFDDFKIINPFYMNKDVREAFLLEVGDLILPDIMDDYSRVDEGPYEYGDVRLYEEDVVFDCGAHIGIFSSVAAFKKCNVYSFEPIESSVKILENTKKLYEENIKIYQYALGDNIGKAKFVINNKQNSQNTMIYNETNTNFINKELVEVNMTTIDKFIEENKIEKIDFIKADIEGAERSMLKGAKNTLKRFAPKLSICTYHLEDDKEVLEKIILEANPNYIIEHKWKKLYAYVK